MRLKGLLIQCFSFDLDKGLGNLKHIVLQSVESSINVVVFLSICSFEKWSHCFLTSLLFFPEGPQKQWHDICHRTVGCFFFSGLSNKAKALTNCQWRAGCCEPRSRKVNANARNDRFCMSVLRWMYVEMNQKCLCWISNSCNWIFLGREEKKKKNFSTHRLKFHLGSKKIMLQRLFSPRSTLWCFVWIFM